MRRMYSEKELSVLVYQAVGQYIEDGAFDEITAESVDAYLEEHPVDITALEGQDIAPKDISATGNITAPSIIETMSGYSLISQTPTGLTLSPVYAGAVKNGNKLTLVFAVDITRTTNLTGSYSNVILFNVPEAIRDKLYPKEINSIAVLSASKVLAIDSSAVAHDVYCIGAKHTFGVIFRLSNSDLNNLTQDEAHYVRIETTFLLSDSLAS